jgi:NAD(P)-dependent dehydrogenase (short-subunit alcohol dehydrogenase family)
VSARFTDKVILVTGASAGIGEASARAFAAEGGRVFLVARGQERGEAVAASIREAGGQAQFFGADVRNPEDVAAMVQGCMQRFGGLHVALNNAGIEGPSGVMTADYTEEMWEQVLAINLSGVWRCMKAELLHMCDGGTSGEGSRAIINMSSIAGLKGFSGACAYAASKAGVIAITRVAAQEYASRGIRINALCPGMIDTDMARRGFLSDPNVAQELVDSYPMKRFGSAAEVADAVLWLASEQSSFVTGTALPIDGGKLA